MIVYDNLWKTMKKRGVSTYTLREKHAIDVTTIQRLRKNRNVQTKTLDKLCAILDCRLEDIATYVKDSEAG